MTARSAVDSLGPSVRAGLARGAELAVESHRVLGWPDAALRDHLIKQWARDIDNAYAPPAMWARGELVLEALVASLDAALAGRG